MISLEKLLDQNKSTVVRDQTFDFDLVTDEEGTWLGSIHFIDCIFSNLFQLNNKIFESSIKMTNCSFKQFRIVDSVFSDIVEIEDCRFDAEVDIYKTTFTSDVQFRGNNFNSGISIFNEKAKPSFVHFNGDFWIH